MHREIIGTHAAPPRCIRDGDHVIYVSLFAAQEPSPYAILASVTLPGDLLEHDDGWNGDWAAYVGSAPVGLAWADALRYIRANGEKLPKDVAEAIFTFTLPYRE